MKVNFKKLLQDVYNEDVEEAILDTEQMFETIDEQDVYFIENQKAGMLIRKNKQEWTTIQGFCKNYGILNQKDFELVLRAKDRNKVRVVNTFRHHAPDELNLMSKEDWIDEKYIVAGAINELTECVLMSLSGGNADALEHIMHWVGHKYLHPDDFMLPALSIYGAQNVGKGIFTNRILPTIFGSRQVFHAHSEDIIGTFNSHAVVGRSIVCVDESNLSKKTDDRLKQLIGNPKVLAHPKGLTPFEVDNCIGYVFTSNDLFGGMKLDSDPSSNRRFSMIKVEKSLPEWLKEFGMDYDKIMEERAIYKNFTDPCEIGKFLFACIQLAKAKGSIRAYHGEDYLDIIEAQHPLNEFFEEVFSQFPAHGVLPTAEVYEQYLDWRIKNDPGGFTLHLKKITAEANKWIKNTGKQIDYKNARHSGGQSRSFVKLGD